MLVCTLGDLLLEEFAGAGRGVEEEDLAGRGAGVLPGVRHALRQKGAAAGLADRHRVADLEGDLAREDIGGVDDARDQQPEKND